jgi:hypothetical protein
MVVRINGDTFAGRLATAVVRTRTEQAGVTVQPRVVALPNTQVGIGDAAAGPGWTTQSFLLTLSAGVHEYELQLLASDGVSPVYGQGYVEIY